MIAHCNAGATSKEALAKKTHDTLSGFWLLRGWRGLGESVKKGKGNSMT